MPLIEKVDLTPTWPHVQRTTYTMVPDGYLFPHVPYVIFSVEGIVAHRDNLDVAWPYPHLADVARRDWWVIPSSTVVGRYLLVEDTWWHRRWFFLYRFAWRLRGEVLDRRHG